MWRRVYLVLLAVRVYFALSPSYLHPDEHFQGPEVIAGDIFDWRITRTWEFTSSAPIRSVFPLWVVYGVPMHLLRWIAPGSEPPSPWLVFNTLRILFFLISFVLEDWALQELIASPRLRRTSLLLLASSFVTWTYQTHTFSNAVETIGVAWALVLIQRIKTSKEAAWLSSGLFGMTVAFCLFNRITFPAFILLPAFQLLPHFLRHPTCIIPLTLTTLLTAGAAVYYDTVFYSANTPTASLTSLTSLFETAPIITPINNLLYNASPANLSNHGLHPRWTHFLVNLPQLLGPAILCLVTIRRASLPVLSAISGISLLSIFPHQEARFLIPAVPLLLCSISLPRNKILNKLWITSWIIFNVLLGTLFGVFHQGGVIPTQVYLGSLPSTLTPTTAVWWKTYSPPTWLLGAKDDSLTTVDLMGSSLDKLIETVEPLADCSQKNYLVAPLSATALDNFISINSPSQSFTLEKKWEYINHFNLDDLDFADDGVLPTIQRVVGRRGLAVWRIGKVGC
ncbi:unnamed protein product [Tuber aestivum]|uniref:Mannosyltransferase n=1 Tax=Tuber aestivum TaxID=59557 RepID=A0A292PXI7_9PEZI|nr:unnamed protein product [Tuber aestivum]